MATARDEAIAEQQEMSLHCGRLLDTLSNFDKFFMSPNLYRSFASCSDNFPPSPRICSVVNQAFPSADDDESNCLSSSCLAAIAYTQCSEHQSTCNVSAVQSPNAHTLTVLSKAVRRPSAFCEYSSALLLTSASSCSFLLPSSVTFFSNTLNQYSSSSTSTLGNSRFKNS